MAKELHSNDFDMEDDRRRGNEHCIKRKSFKRFFLLPVCAMILSFSFAACGGDDDKDSGFSSDLIDDDNNSDISDTSSNWDEMVWDQDNWG